MPITKTVSVRSTFASACLGAFALVSACGGEAKPGPAAPNAADPSKAGGAGESAATPPPAETKTAGTAAPQGAAPKKMSVDECKSLREEAQSEMDAEIIKVDKACKAIADCEIVKGHACDFSCATVAIPKSELADWNAELTKMKEGACKKWTENDCPTINPPRAAAGGGAPPWCRDDKKLACEKGHCVLK